MRRFLCALLLLTACASAKKETGVLAPNCGKTDINVKDIEAFGFTAPKNKVAVVRVMSTWCPYCKEDLAEIGGHFRNGDYPPDKVHILLMMYKNPRENKDTYDKFLRDTFTKFGIPSQAAQIVFINKTAAELSATKTSKGHPLLTGWQGVPFSLVFAKDGRLAFRGHFTTSPQYQDNHYVFIKDLVKEACP